MILEFEKPIAELDAKVAELRRMDGSSGVALAEEIARLESKADRLLRAAYAKLTPDQKVAIARHPNRPHTNEYISTLFEDFTPLAGDRLYAEDEAMLSGIGRFRGLSCVVLGQERGHDTETRIKHNFGMAKPEGYRKAQRLMDMAERFHLPVVTFVDTAGAFPGIEAEERGQSEAIARSIEKCLSLTVPIISVVIGEGGSGGAIAIATGNRVYMLEHAVYSVISPEGCASILWRSASHAKDAAQALRITAQDLLELKLIDGIIPEPIGGAHRHKEDTVRVVGDTVDKALRALLPMSPEQLKRQRAEKFLAMGRDIAA